MLRQPFVVSSILLAGAIALVGRPATASTAYQHMTNINQGEQYGNSDIYASWGYMSYELARLDLTEPPTVAENTVLRTSESGVGLWTTAGLFGLQKVPISASTWARATQNRVGSASSTYFAGVAGNVAVMGSQWYYLPLSSPACPSGSGPGNCAGFDRSASTTLFSTSKTFTLGPIPVTVDGSVVATMHEGLSSKAYSARYVGSANTFYGSTSANLNASAYLSANFGAFAGIPDVVGVGVTASFRLLEIAVTPASSNTFVSSPTGLTQYSNSMPLTVRTMSGRVDVTATLGFSYTKNIVSWSGYSNTWNLYNTSGSQKFDF